MTDGNNANRTAVALGNFDGMHVGHMAVLEAAKSFESEGLLPVAILFDEHSLKAITGKAPAMLMTVTERNKLVVDAYNANPTSMNAAVENFKRMEVSPKMVILGEMGELGTSSHEEHLKLVAQLREASFDVVWLVGGEFIKANSGFRTFADVEEVKAAIAAENIRDRYILIKGSHSTKLYELPELL